MRPSLIWVRDMLRYAWIRVKSKSFESMVIANTELLPVSMICNWADIRSFGKLFDIRNMDDISRKAFYDSHRLGCNSLMNASQSVDRQLISLSLLYMASPVLDKTTVNESDLILPYKVLESFGVSRSSLLYTEIRADENLRINIHKHESILMTMVNISPDELDSDIDILQFDPGLQEDKEYMVYEPLSKSLFGDKDPWKYEEFLRFHVTIPSYDYRILYIREKPNKNCVLFALGSNRVLEEHFDVQSGSLSFSLEAMVNTKLSVVIYCSKKPSQILSNDTIRHFVWNDDQKLAFLDINADRSVTEVKVL